MLIVKLCDLLCRFCDAEICSYFQEYFYVAGFQWDKKLSLRGGDIVTGPLIALSVGNKISLSLSVSQCVCPTGSGPINATSRFR